MWARTYLNDRTVEQIQRELQPLLADLIHLGLISKQAHWVVHGPKFLTVHERLETLTTVVGELADQIAQRLSTLGRSPQIDPSRVATDSRLSSYPSGYQGDRETLALVRDAVSQLCQQVRRACERMEDVDSQTEDLLLTTGRKLKERLWSLQGTEVRF